MGKEQSMKLKEKTDKTKKGKRKRFYFARTELLSKLFTLFTSEMASIPSNIRSP